MLGGGHALAPLRTAFFLTTLRPPYDHLTTILVQLYLSCTSPFGKRKCCVCSLSSTRRQEKVPGQQSDMGSAALHLLALWSVLPLVHAAASAKGCSVTSTWPDGTTVERCARAPVR